MTASPPLAGTARRCLVAAWLIAAVLAFGLVVCRAQGEDADALGKLAEGLQEALPTSDICLLLDASGSMSGFYGAARAAAVRFAERLTPRETMEARAFAANVSHAIQGSGSQAGEALKRGLPPVPLPGQGTDIGLALQKALEFLDRRDASPVQALFLLTDGMHQPLADSPYGPDWQADPDWRALRRRAHALAQRTRLVVYGVGLRDHTDIGVLRSVFPAANVEIVTGDVAEAAAALSRMRRKMLVERLWLLLDNELSAGRLKVSLKRKADGTGPRTPECVFRLQNGYRHLPVSLTNVTVRPATGSGEAIRGELVPRPPARLEGGQTWEGVLRLKIAAKMPSEWALGRRCVSEAMQWKVDVAASFAEADKEALSRLGLGTTVASDFASERMRVAVCHGKAWRVIIGLALSLVVTVVGWMRRQTFTPQHAVAGAIAIGGRTYNLAEFGKETLTCGPPESDIPVSGIGESYEAIELVLYRDGDFVQLGARSKSPSVQVNAEPLAGEQMLSTGDTVTLGRNQIAVLDDGRAQIRHSHPAMLAAGILLSAVSLVSLIAFYKPEVQLY